MLRYVHDEHLRGPVWRAIQQHNAGGAYPIDVVRAGDPDDLPLGTQDPELLAWAEREARIVITSDRRSMTAHLQDHLNAGGHSPGVFSIRRHTTIPEVVSFLVLAPHASDPDDWKDSITFIP